jgi:hypothetical protein
MNKILVLLSSTFVLIPHGYCLSWLRELLLLHVISDSLITLAYLLCGAN